MQVNPEDGPPEIYVTWSDPRMTDFKNGYINMIVWLAFTRTMHLMDFDERFYHIKSNRTCFKFRHN